MAKQLTGTVVRIWRAFGRVRFTVTWETGETARITVPKRQIDATIRAGDTVGTILPDPPYTAADLMQWIMRDPAAEPSPQPPHAPIETPDKPPSEWQYHRVGGPAAR